MEQANHDQLSDVGLQVDSEVRKSLADTAKWSKFISVTVFIFCGLLLLLGIVGGSFLASVFNRFGSGRYGQIFENGAALIIGVIIFVVAIIVVIYYFLFNFARRIKAALATENTEALHAGLNSLKTYFIIITILTGLALLSTLKQLF